MLQIQKSSPAGRGIGSIGGEGKGRFEVHPTQGATLRIVANFSVDFISIHAPQGGDKENPLYQDEMDKFQFAPPRGGGDLLSKLYARFGITISIRAPMQGATAVTAVLSFYLKRFQFTPLYGDDPCLR